MELQIYQGKISDVLSLLITSNLWYLTYHLLHLQDVANWSFLKSQALYQTISNRDTLAQKNAKIAKRLDEALAARNKLYEANCEQTRELYRMKQQIKSLKEEKTKLQEQLQTAQAGKHLNSWSDNSSPIIA